MRSFEWTLATTTSRRASSVVLQVELAVLQDVDLHPGQDPEGGEALVEHGQVVELGEEPLPVEAVGDRQPAGVVGEHHVLVAEGDGRRRHVLDAGAAVAPRGVGVAVAPERGPVGGRLGAHLDHRLGLELGQVGGDLAVDGLADHAGGRVADARQLGQRAGPGPLLELGRVGGHDDVERPHPGLRLEAGHVGAVQAVDDPLQGLDGGHRARLRAAARAALAAGLARIRRTGETNPRQTPLGGLAAARRRRGLARVRHHRRDDPAPDAAGGLARAGPLASGRDPARRAR